MNDYTGAWHDPFIDSGRSCFTSRQVKIRNSQ